MDAALGSAIASPAVDFARNQKTAAQLLLSSESNEWYSPPWTFDLIRRVAPIGLDPASNAIAQQWIQAQIWHGLPQDAMRLSWQTPHGTLFWMNPPYGVACGKFKLGKKQCPIVYLLLWLRSPIEIIAHQFNWFVPVYGAGAWIKRAIATYDSGQMALGGVLLVRGDSESVHDLERRFVSCEPFERIPFFSPSAPDKNSPVPGCRFWFLAEGDTLFGLCNSFSEVGSIRSPYRW